MVTRKIVSEPSSTRRALCTSAIWSVGVLMLVYVVFGGMLAATALGVFVIPSLFVLVEGLIGKTSRSRAAGAAAAQPPPGVAVPAQAPREDPL